MIVLDRLIRGGGRQAMILADVEGVRASLSEQGAQRVGKDYEVEPVAVTSGVFHPKVSVFSGPEASGKPTAIEPEFEFRRGRYRHRHHAFTRRCYWGGGSVRFRRDAFCSIRSLSRQSATAGTHGYQHAWGMPPVVGHPWRTNRLKQKYVSVS